MNKRPKILIVGSLAMDLTVSTERFPGSGESVFGCGFSTAPGGKGANQAVQAARLGADVSMVGKVGNDDFGKELIRSAEESGMDMSRVKVCHTAPTAISNIMLEVKETGTENRIIAVTGANMEMSEEDVEFLKTEITDFDMVMMQNEIPQCVNEKVAKIAKDAGVPVMLNPAPAAKLSKELISCLTYISPNEHEAQDITGVAPEGDGKIREVIDKLLDMGAENAIITLGKKGAAFSGGGEVLLSPSVDTGRVVDPTAAGDSFVSSFCTAVAAGIDIENSMKFANFTASITVSRMGAQTSLPTISEVLAAMKAKGCDTELFSGLER